MFSSLPKLADLRTILHSTAVLTEYLNNTIYWTIKTYLSIKILNGQQCYQMTVSWLSVGMKFRSGNRTPKAAPVEGDQRLWRQGTGSVLVHYECAWQTSHLHTMKQKYTNVSFDNHRDDMGRLQMQDWTMMNEGKLQ